MTSNTYSPSTSEVMRTYLGSGCVSEVVGGGIADLFFGFLPLFFLAGTVLILRVPILRFSFSYGYNIRDDTEK